MDNKYPSFSNGQRNVCMMMFEIRCSFSQLQEKFEYIKGVIRSRKSTMDRQHNGQKKKN
jgi:hypothetical protein